MFQPGGLIALRLEHRHEDGSWGQLEPRPSHHDPANHDPERNWPKDRIYVCTTCDETVRVTEPTSERAPADP